MCPEACTAGVLGCLSSTPADVLTKAKPWCLGTLCILPTASDTPLAKAGVCCWQHPALLQLPVNIIPMRSLYQELLQPRHQACVYGAGQTRSNRCGLEMFA